MTSAVTGGAAPCFLPRVPLLFFAEEADAVFRGAGFLFFAAVFAAVFFAGNASSSVLLSQSSPLVFQNNGSLAGVSYRICLYVAAGFPATCKGSPFLFLFHIGSALSPPIDHLLQTIHSVGQRAQPIDKTFLHSIGTVQDRSHVHDKFLSVHS